MTVREEIAKNLHFYRKNRGITQKELASKVGVTNSAISNWEKGLNSIDIDTLHNVCAALNVSIGEMFGAYSNSSVDSAKPINQPRLTKREQMLLDDFRSLSEQGQDYILQTMNMVKDKYKKDNSYSVLETAG